MNQELSHTARVSPLASYTDARYQNLLQMVRDAGVAEGVEPFLFDAEISNDLLDSHYTHMNEKTLENYAEDAKRGVAFLRGHNWKELPIGYSLDGTVEKGTKIRTIANFYTVPGMPDTDDLIGRIKSGLLRDVSVGFHGGTMRCDICQSEFWDCRHWPGLKYEEKKGDVVTVKLATYTIEDANLSEVSGVFDGSTPDAMILKAQRAAQAGDLTLEQIEILSNKYRISLPTKKTFPVTKKESRMTEEEITKMRTILGVATDEEIVSGAEILQRKLAELTPQAADGVAYRNDLVTDALAQGVRAQGKEFDATAYEAILRVAPIDTIKRMRDDWKRMADKLIPTGRHSVDTDNEPKKKVSATPDYAFQ